MPDFLQSNDIHRDKRGFFENINFKKLNNPQQINFVFNIKSGTIRGMHFQKKPKNESKILIVTNGIIRDVLIDIRKNSKTFLKKFYFTLNSTSKNNTIYIPKGFLHGYQTLSDNVSLVYLHEKKDYPSLSETIIYNDPQLKIKWPLKPNNISDNDLKGKEFNEKFCL